MSFYKIQAKSNKSAEIHIYGDIGESWWGESVTARQFVKDVAALDVDNLVVRINSYGGSVADGIAIYNAIKRHKATTTVVIDSIAASVASLIAMAGDSVEMAENALMMIHAPWSYAGGNAVDFREAADVLDKFAAAMSSSYANKTGKTTEAVMNWLTDGADHWFTAAEAQAENLIDNVTAALQVAASFDLSRYKSMPAAAGVFNKPVIQETTMPKTEATNLAASEQQPANTTQPTAAVNTAEIEARTLAKETERRYAIRARFSMMLKKYPSAGLEPVMNDCLDDPTISIEAATNRLMDKLGEGQEPIAGNHHHRIETGESDVEKFARGVGQAVMARLSMVKAALAMRPSASGYGQTTSDFPVLLENVMHRMVLTAYNATPDTWSQFCVTGSVSDFREWQRLRVGSIGDIEDVNEAGEYKNRIIPDAAKEGITAKCRGNIIGITPEVIINDDIGYIASLTTNLGRAGKRTIENKVFALLASNPTMKDGVALFHANHGNLAASGAVPSVDSLEAARVAMASQMDIGGNEYLDVSPAIWLGGLAKGGDVRVLVGAQYDPDTANKLQKPNKVNGIVQNIVDTPRISGTEWYFFADPTVAPVIEVVFLDGQSEPLLAMEEQFNTGGVNYRVELPFGVGAIGYEGAYKNPGA